MPELNQTQITTEKKANLCEQDLIRAGRYLHVLQREINQLRHSFTWRIGSRITAFILKLLNRQAGTTALDVIDGISPSVYHFLETLKTKPYLATTHWFNTEEYRAWQQRYCVLTETQKKQLKTKAAQFDSSIQIAVLIFVQDISQLELTLNSLKQQLCDHWRVILLTNKEEDNKTIKTQYGNTSKISVFYEKNSSEIELINSLLRYLPEAFFIRFNNGDKIEEYGIYKMIEALYFAPNAPFWYADESHLDHNHCCENPYFKSDWNIDLFYAAPYVLDTVLFNTKKVLKLGGFKTNDADLLEYDMVLRLIEQDNKEKPYHIPHILYHKTVHHAVLNYENIKNRLTAHFERLGQIVRIELYHAEYAPSFKINYPIPNPNPLVSIIIPIRDKVELLQSLINDLMNKTAYQNIEIIIVDNNSEKVETLTYLSSLSQYKNISLLTQKYPFNYSKLNNEAVKQAKGEILAFLNNDLKIIHVDWLSEMVAHAVRPDIGAVGAKLYYPDDTLQHAGVLLNFSGIGQHVLKHFFRQDTGYWHKLMHTQNYTAVTAACLVMRKTVFEQVNGFEEKLKVAFNDVDLCLKLTQQHYRIVWTPFAELYHLESVSRGQDQGFFQHLRLRQELTFMQRKWKKELNHDPYNNPNLSPLAANYQLAYPPKKSLI
ncbi:glycosyltransferase family 2 protein [Thioflexithrix psekupsensis]|uniref:Glycosyltransferase 2-like domain-containing protein n=1 Tax=Thioflexithrix psekupsensis TaxID=1570016 RepID=A0A251X764_9GAMM|nr:glycosyltransferase family 2 protein [Thioflexithrix psekupsensis]OUD13170.1 hypothetical protein TPSD3_11045 [Thioflexithrix psekupsensis]